MSPVTVPPDVLVEPRRPPDDTHHCMVPGRALAQYTGGFEPVGQGGIREYDRFQFRKILFDPHHLVDDLVELPGGDVASDPPVAEEAAVGIEPLRQLEEVRPARIQRRQVGRLGPEDLAPVRPRAQRQQRRLDPVDQRVHAQRLAPPGEVDREHVLAVRLRQPQVVGRHRAQLRHEEHLAQVLPERAYGGKRLDGP